MDLQYKEPTRKQYRHDVYLPKELHLTSIGHGQALKIEMFLQDEGFNKDKTVYYAWVYEKQTWRFFQ